MLTRKHFELIANDIRTAEEWVNRLEAEGEHVCPRHALRLLRKLLADDFAAVNPRFDLARFIKACTPKTTEGR